MLLSYIGYASAQERGFAWGAFGSSSQMGQRFSSLRLETYAGYNISSTFSTFLKAENEIVLRKSEQQESHHSLQTLGVLTKYNIYRFKTGILDFRAGVGTNLFTKDWRYLYYDAGLFVQATREYTKPTIGVGFRYYDTLEKGSKDYPMVYISVGFTVN